MLNYEFLKKEDEEFHMMREVARNVTDRLAHAKERGERKTTGQISGEETEKVVRNHLVGKGFNISRNRVFIEPSAIEVDLLQLKNAINPNSTKYFQNQVSTVLEVKNNAVPTKRNNVPIQPSEVIRENFNQLEKDAKVNRFAVVVLSERLLSKKPYKYAITDDKIKKENCHVFTLVARRKPAKSLYSVSVISDSWKTRNCGELKTGRGSFHI